MRDRFVDGLTTPSRPLRSELLAPGDYVLYARAAESAAQRMAFTIGAVLLSASGNLTASRNRSRGLPFWPALGFGMLYGAASCALFGLLQGQSFLPPAVLSWWLSLLYLALAGSRSSVA